MEQQENEEEINDDYRPTTNGSDTSTLPEANIENEDNVSSNGTMAAVNPPPTTDPPNWNQSELRFLIVSRTFIIYCLC